MDKREEETRKESSRKERIGKEVRNLGEQESRKKSVSETRPGGQQCYESN